MSDVRAYVANIYKYSLACKMVTPSTAAKPDVLKSTRPVARQ
jgi:hypothetical protein